MLGILANASEKKVPTTKHIHNIYKSNTEYTAVYGLWKFVFLLLMWCWLVWSQTNFMVNKKWFYFPQVVRLIYLIKCICSYWNVKIECRLDIRKTGQRLLVNRGLQLCNFLEKIAIWWRNIRCQHILQLYFLFRYYYCLLFCVSVAIKTLLYL